MLWSTKQAEAAFKLPYCVYHFTHISIHGMFSDLLIGLIEYFSQISKTLSILTLSEYSTNIVLTDNNISHLENVRFVIHQEVQISCLVREEGKD